MTSLITDSIDDALSCCIVIKSYLTSCLIDSSNLGTITRNGVFISVECLVSVNALIVVNYALVNHFICICLRLPFVLNIHTRKSRRVICRNERLVITISSIWLRSDNPSSLSTCNCVSLNDLLLLWCEVVLAGICSCSQNNLIAFEVISNRTAPNLDVLTVKWAVAVEYYSIETIIMTIQTEPVINVLSLDTECTDFSTSEFYSELDVEVIVLSTSTLITLITSVCCINNLTILIELTIVCEVFKFSSCEFNPECIVSCTVNVLSVIYSTYLVKLS